MGTVVAATIPQTLYVSVRRDEYNALKDQQAALKAEVAQLTALLAQAQHAVLLMQQQNRIA